MQVLGGGRLQDKPFALGIITVVVLALLVGLSLQSGTLYRAVAGKGYTALFTEVGGLRTGDEVRIGGVAVGKITAIELAGDKAAVSFTVSDVSRIGSTTGAAIKTATALGSRYVAVLPSGPGELETGSTIPAERTSSAFDVQALLSQLTRKTQQLDIPQLAQAMNVVSDTFQNTPEGVRGALNGLQRLSTTISSRDDELEELLRNANGVTGILASRSTQITTLVTDGNLLLDELYRRRDTIRSLLANITRVLTSFTAVVRDNQAQIGPALAELRGVLDLLNRNDKNLAAAIEGLRTYAGSLGEAVSGGPWFFALVPNLAPTNLAQQTLPSVLDGLTPPVLGNSALGTAVPSLGAAGGALPR